MTHVIDIKSSYLSSPVYYDDEEGVLTVKFKASGKRKEYFGVSYDEFQSIVHPGDEFNQSVGRAFSAIVTRNKEGRWI